ncbi:hypothetical protein [Nonomuraea rubra]
MWMCCARDYLSTFMKIGTSC